MSAFSAASAADTIHCQLSPPLSTPTDTPPQQCTKLFASFSAHGSVWANWEKEPYWARWTRQRGEKPLCYLTGGLKGLWRQKKKKTKSMPLGHTSILLGRIVFLINIPILEVHFHDSFTWNLRLRKSVCKAMCNYLQYIMCIVYTLQSSWEIMPFIQLCVYYKRKISMNTYSLMDVLNEDIYVYIHIFYLLERKTWL